MTALIYGTLHVLLALVPQVHALITTHSYLLVFLRQSCYVALPNLA